MCKPHIEEEDINLIEWRSRQSIPECLGACEGLDLVARSPECALQGPAYALVVFEKSDEHPNRPLTIVTL